MSNKILENGSILKTKELTPDELAKKRFEESDKDLPNTVAEGIKPKDLAENVIKQHEKDLQVKIKHEKEDELIKTEKVSVDDIVNKRVKEFNNKVPKTVDF